MMYKTYARMYSGRENHRGQPVGVIVAQAYSDGSIHIGWSQINQNSNDIFNKQFGTDVALGRLDTVPIIVDRNGQYSSHRRNGDDRMEYLWDVLSHEMTQAIQEAVTEITANPQKYMAEEVEYIFE